MLDLKGKLSLESVVTKYKKEYPLLARLKETRQDLVWHREGDCFIHTQMVMDECQSLLESHPISGELTESQKKVLLFSCIFHDYAKPITTKDDERDGRMCVVASGHEFIGASLLLNLATPDELTDSEWLSVVKLVAYHQMPKKAIRGDYSFGQYLELLRHCGDIKLLYLLEIADMKGRVADDTDNELLTLELFRDEAETHELFCDYDSYYKKHLEEIELQVGENALIQGLSDLAGNTIQSLDTIKHMPYSFNEKAEFIVMSGLPASGKSTYIKEHYPEHAVVSLDEIRKEISGKASSQVDNDEVVRVAHERLKVLFRQGVKVVYDTTAYRKDFVEKVTFLSHRYGYVSKVVVLCTPLSRCLTNNASRDRVVPVEAIMGIHNAYQMPFLGSTHKLNFVR